MTTAEVLKQNSPADVVEGGLNATSTQEIEAILEKAEQSEDRPKTGQWYYRVPFAGVRYYSFSADPVGPQS